MHYKRRVFSQWLVVVINFVVQVRGRLSVVHLEPLYTYVYRNVSFQ